MEDQSFTGSTSKPMICAAGEEGTLPSMYSPRIDTPAALRYNYRLARPSIDTSDENDWYKCSSKHVRGLTRQRILEENYESQPFSESWLAAGFTEEDARGVFFQIRLFDFDKGGGNRGGAEPFYEEEITMFSDAGNLLYWQYPPERMACGGDMTAVRDEIMVAAVDADGNGLAGREQECQTIHANLSTNSISASHCASGEDCVFSIDTPLNDMQLELRAQATGYPSRLDYFSLAFCTNIEAWNTFLHSSEQDLSPLQSSSTTFGLKFTAMLRGGSSNNPLQQEFRPSDGDRYCESALRAIDVFYTLRTGSLRATLKAGYTGPEKMPQGRNLFLGGSSQAKVCVEMDENANICEDQSSCIDGYFCSESCISGLCGLPSMWENNLGKAYAEGGYGVCQNCSDCVYDDEVYDPATGLTANKPTCSEACKGLAPSSAQPDFTVAAFHRCAGVDMRHHIWCTKTKRSSTAQA